MQQVYKQEFGTPYSLFNVLNIKACFTKKGNVEQDDIRSLHGPFCNATGFFHSHKIPTRAKRQTSLTLETDKIYSC